MAPIGRTLFWGAPKSLQMVTVAMKLKDAYSLEEKLWPTRQHIKKERHYFANKGPSSQSYGFSSSHLWMWEWTIKKAEQWRNDAFQLWCWRDSWVPWTARGSNQSIKRKSVLNIHWKDWCWKWKSNTLATWCEELTRLKRPWCWERLKVGGEGDNRGWDGWMADGINQLNEDEFGSTLGVGDGQGSLVCCSPWACKESDTTEWLD